MAGNSTIEWTESTWNPIVGCSIVSPGCIKCYAMKEAYRFGFNPQLERYHGLTKLVNGKPVWTGKLALAPETTLLSPLKRKKPTTYFVNSMGDLFHEDCPDEWIDKVFAVMALSPQHTFQVLTKRATRMREYFADVKLRGIDIAMTALDMAIWSDPEFYHPSVEAICNGNPLPNVWLGVSTERQQEADERIPLLLQTPASVRFISAEPLLGPIDLVGTLARFQDDLIAKRQCAVPLGRQLIDWVIVGGESGADARPMHPDWARSLRDQCQAAGLSFFFKQFGAWIAFYDRDRDDPDWRNLPEIDNQMGRGATRWHNLAGGTGFHGERLVAMRHVGKKAAGRLLDGELHNAMPARASS